MTPVRPLLQVQSLRASYLSINPSNRQTLMRYQSSLTTTHLEKPTPTSSQSQVQKQAPRLLARIPTPNLLRSIFLGTIFTSPKLFKASLSCLSLIANSSSRFLDVDRNIALRGIVKPLIYNQFCAGTNAVEVGRTVKGLKDMGYEGVILIYSKEIPATMGLERAVLMEVEVDADVEIWLEGNLKTLEMVEEGDYVGVKFTGAGPRIAQALAQGREPPKQFLDAMDTICQRAAARKSRVWVDAEQQVFQPTIDRWTVELMRRHNRNGEALVSLTIQAYLKSARKNVAKLLRLAKDEDWTLGIKLVRGAYIGSEVRDKIHDTKAQTDECYDGIAADLLTKRFSGFRGEFPEVEVFLAGHNSDSIRKAYALYKEMMGKGEACSQVKFGQLLGMADDISCELLQMDGEKGRNEKEVKPLVYKCMNWGSVRECMHYLVRRATENQSAAERMKHNVAEMKREVWRRVSMF